MTLNIYQPKVLCMYTKYLPPEAQILVLFTLWSAFFHIKVVKLGKIGNALNYLIATLNGKKSNLYVLSNHTGLKFWSGLLYEQPLLIYCGFHISLFDYHVTRPKKNKKLPKKIKISNSTIRLATLAETLPRNLRGFWGANLVYTFRGDVV